MRTNKKLWRNRKAKKELARQLQSEDPGLEVVHPHAAGIDVGNSAHYVAVRPDHNPQPVRRYCTVGGYGLSRCVWVGGFYYRNIDHGRFAQNSRSPMT